MHVTSWHIAIVTNHSLVPFRMFLLTYLCITTELAQSKDAEIVFTWDGEIVLTEYSPRTVSLTAFITNIKSCITWVSTYHHQVIFSRLSGHKKESVLYIREYSAVRVDRIDKWVCVSLRPHHINVWCCLTTQCYRVAVVHGSVFCTANTITIQLSVNQSIRAVLDRDHDRDLS